jgi:type IV pilus assembly protein PilQ
MSKLRSVTSFHARWYKAALACVFALVLPWSAIAQTNTTLDNISFSQLPGNRVQVQLTLSNTVSDPLNFAIDNPARIALDFPNVKLNLARRSENIGVGMARSVNAVEAAGRTRVVLNLIKLVPYKLATSGKQVLITLESAGQAASTALTAASDAPRSASQGPRANIDNIDFRRGASGEGRIIVTLSDPSVVIDTKEEGERIVVDFIGADLPQRLAQKLDVLDFATPVRSVTTRIQGRNVRMIVAAGGKFETLAYQSDDLFTLDVKPVLEEESAESARKKEQFTGERLSLNFQNIEVRAVLQLIADFTGLNLVASDTVGGTLTLRLKNVPWDQALDIILKTKGLAMRQTGNVMLVAPSEEIAARERLELESQKQIEELAPLRSEFVQVNYAKAAVLAGLLKAEGNSLMTERGNVSVDDRTNTLLVRDTQTALNAIRALVSRLDVPVRQVLIESRIVIADDTFNRDLGVRFGLSKQAQGSNRDAFILGGGLPGNTDFNGTSTFNTGGNENFLVDLPIGGPVADLQLAILSLPDFLLQLELQAAQAEGRGEVISNPRVITSNQKEAVIEQGTEIPFQEASSSGATSTSFKKAVLSLRVTPQITPDDRVIMDLSVTQDTVGQEFSGIPAVNTRNINTQVLVDNGDTVVLGGVFEQTKREDQTKVPFFGDLPYFGFLFKSTSVRDDKTELLIFVTPKILKDVVRGNN